MNGTSSGEMVRNFNRKLMKDNVMGEYKW